MADEKKPVLAENDIADLLKIIEERRKPVETPKDEKKPMTLRERLDARKAGTVTKSKPDDVQAVKELLDEYRKKKQPKEEVKQDAKEETPMQQEDWETSLVESCEKFKIPKPNREIVKILVEKQAESGEPIDLAKAIPELVKRFPILTRTANYPNIISGKGKMTEKDVKDLGLNERGELLRKKLGI